jgi:hypothetical protein
MFNRKWSQTNARCTMSIAAVTLVASLLTTVADGFVFAGVKVDQDVRLTGEPDSKTHYYEMTTEVSHVAFNGQRKSADVYKVWLEYEPHPDGDKVTCRRFTVRVGETPEVELPSLKDWSYTFRRAVSGLDERGRIFGIEQSKFEGLADDKGNVLPPTVAYLVFNAFVDFHSFAQVFAERTTEGNGIQDLRRIGQKVLHSSAHSEPPVSLGTFVEKGSTFKNGAVTLELKGLSLVKGRSCAIVGFDSGESTFHMILKPAPQVAINVNGGSRYLGDLYVDLETQWLLKATLFEFVVSETTGAVLPESVKSVEKRMLLLTALDKAEFERAR